MKFLKVGKYRIGFDLRELTKNIIGMGSICEDGEHCLFFDLDNINELKLRKSIVTLQEKCDLGDCYVFLTSTDSYHAVFLDKMSRGMIINLHDYFSAITKNWDDTGLINHDMSSLRRRYWTLRLNSRGKDQIKYVGTIKSNNLCGWNKKSNAHRKLLNKLYKLNIEKTPEFDDYKGIIFDHYTAKKKRI
jgi:hypothetical protein